MKDKGEKEFSQDFLGHSSVALGFGFMEEVGLVLEDYTLFE